MKKTLIGLAAAAVLAAGSWAPAADASAKAPSNPPADCCCVVENGELICTITGEVLRECCCK